MTKVIGRFIPTGTADYRQPFNVVTMEPSQYLAPAWHGKREDGEEYHVIERAWKFEPAWSGDGLPPVGIECEGKQFAQLNWTKFKVVAVENGHVFGFWNDSVSVGLNSKLWQFRPIRSERDEAIERMRKVVTNYNKTDVIHAIEQLYDAGYRKLSD